MACLISSPDHQLSDFQQSPRRHYHVFGNPLNQKVSLFPTLPAAGSSIAASSNHTIPSASGNFRSHFTIASSLPLVTTDNMGDFRSTPVPDHHSSLAAFDIPIVSLEHVVSLRKREIDLKRQLCRSLNSASPQKRRTLEIELLENTQKQCYERKVDSFTAQKLEVIHSEAHLREVEQASTVIVQTQKMIGDRVIELGSDANVRFPVDSTPTAWSILYALYQPQGSRPRQLQQDLRQQSIRCYESDKGLRCKDTLWCPILAEETDVDSMRAAHIVPHKVQPAIMSHILGVGADTQKWEPSNSLMIHSEFEKAFDKCHLITIADAGSQMDDFEVTIHIVSNDFKSISDRLMGGIKVKEFEGRKLYFRNKNRPARRFL
jgi:hypothetical protein